MILGNVWHLIKIINHHAKRLLLGEWCGISMLVHGMDKRAIIEMKAGNWVSWLAIEPQQQPLAVIQP